MSLKDTRIFNHKRYYLRGHTQSKALAQRESKKYRDLGKNVRITSVKEGNHRLYAVWIQGGY